MLPASAGAAAAKVLVCFCIMLFVKFPPLGGRENEEKIKKNKKLKVRNNFVAWACLVPSTCNSEGSITLNPGPVEFFLYLPVVNLMLILQAEIGRFFAPPPRGEFSK